MFCTKCGNNLGVEDNFCGKCGKAVENSYTPKSHTVENRQVEHKTLPEVPVEPAPVYEAPARPIRQSKQEKTETKLKADLKKILEEKSGKEVTEAELNEAEWWLKQYADIVWDVAVEEAKRSKKLEQNPKGFHLEGKGYSCHICGSSASNEESWYDKYGIKCLVCQKAVDENIIPPTVAEDKDSWYSAYDLESDFCINRHGLRRFIKEGLLKPRVIKGLSGRPHFQLFLIEDNKDTLPPKKLVDSKMVKETKDGQDWFHSEPWFQFDDPTEVLKGYKIIDYLKTLKEHEIQKTAGRLTVQFSRGASTFFDINYVNKDQPSSTATADPTRIKK